nr:N-6 DNA Methylase [Candidatus Prometheoarchaeum syntrophicum]
MNELNSAIIKDLITKIGFPSEESKEYPYTKNLAKFKLIFTKTKNRYFEILCLNQNKLKTEILDYLGYQNQEEKHKFSDHELQNLASQASHLILNKMFSYYVIQAQVHKHYGIKLENLYVPSSEQTFQDQIKEKFKDIVNTFEIAPIFQTDSFDEIIQFSDNLSIILQEANKFFVNLHIEELNEDIISNLYQMFIPLEEKKKLGQIYTPQDIAQLMVKLTVQNPNELVLDPACGCGTLLHKVYYRLKNLKIEAKIPLNHKDLLSQIWGIEINPFPAQIAMMSLAFMDISKITQVSGILLEDFLNIGPLKNYFVKSMNFKTGKIITRELPKKFDVIIANPPYIKQELIPNKKLMMKNLPIFASYREKNILPSNVLKKTQKIKLELTGKTDYYGFFLWYSNYFLRDQGKLCFIVPNKWMDVEYGKKLKKFIKENFKIIAVIGFNQNVFENAQVSTLIIILKKEKDNFKRKHHYVKFINILEKEGRQKLEYLVNSSLRPIFKAEIDWNGYLFKNESNSLQCTYIRQDHLNYLEKWSIKYLYQSHFARILKKKSLIAMDNLEITSVIGGIKTGANDFYFPSENDQKKYSIEPQFLIPGIKTGRKIPSKIIIDQAKNQFLSIPSETNISKYPGLHSYISHGENSKKYHERRSVHWKPWYSIPKNKQDTPDILFLRHINKNFKARWNKVKCVVADGVRGIRVNNPDHLLFYLGICNSTYFYWQAHICGRWEGQGDLQLLVYELRQFLIPDIRKIPQEKIVNVEKCMNKIIFETQNSKSKEYDTMSILHKNLDIAVLDCLDLKNNYELLQKETNYLEQSRLTKKL